MNDTVFTTILIFTCDKLFIKCKKSFPIVSLFYNVNKTLVKYKNR